MNPADTIVAISSATGPAGRMIVRLAGPMSTRLLSGISRDAKAVASSAERHVLHFQDVECPAWIYVFVGPRSYTGDDLIELHLPGHPLLARMLLDTLIASGARMAEAGEFTARAFLNGRLDLAEAEGVALTIAATHAGELRAARQLVAGELSRRLAGPLTQLADALALLESNIDFAEEDIAFIDAAEVRLRVVAAMGALDDLADGVMPVEQLSGEPSFVLVGLPNAGKSTLLNALAGVQRAVVSPSAGTTRDALSVEIALPRGLVRLIDIAGLESGGEDEIGRQMQAHAVRTVEAADFIVEVRDATSAKRSWLPRPADAVVRTKVDLLQAEQGMVGETASRTALAKTESRPLLPEFAVSAVTGVGLDDLRTGLNGLAFGADGGQTLALTARHVGAVGSARDALRRATALPDASTEMIADELRRAVDALGQVLGRVSPDDVLGRVFATFCVGK